MIASADANGTPPTLGENDLIAGYDKVISIRDHLLANKPSVKVFNQSASLANAKSSTGPLPNGSVTEAPNGLHKPPQVSNPLSAPTSDLKVPKTRQFQPQPKSPSVQKNPNPSPGSSGIDPIFLTKSDVLVRAETHQKRQRLERALEEQVHRQQRQRAAEPEGLPDFDVTEVLRRAQEIVKPVKLTESSQTNGGALSSDSFDENTFYSSQMDESTTTEEADESHKRRPNKICSFFFRGEPCKYGEKCIFSHDPVLKRKLEAGGSQGMDLERVNADEQTSSRKKNGPNKRTRIDAPQPKPPSKEPVVDSAPSLSQEERERKERIARLEAELRKAKAEEQSLPIGVPRRASHEVHEPHGGPAYSAPGPDEFGRDAALREPESWRAATAYQRRAVTDGQPQISEYGRRIGNLSPLPSDGRIVTNHIRSPVAPQPSRVSPLAVTKVPQVSQVQRGFVENQSSSRASNVEPVSAGQSPNVASQARGSRKRRRGLDSGEQVRNVAPRTDYGSRAVRVKEEPMSPPPMSIVEPNVRQVRPRQVYVDTTVPQYYDQDPLSHQTKIVERAPYDQTSDGRAPQTPLIRRIISRNGQRYVASEEQDLRRVVTAPRQVRAPMSPASYPVQYSAPQPRPTRAASHVHISPTPHQAPLQYKVPAQPSVSTYAPIDRSPSPSNHRLPQSPVGRPQITMAPPPRRIVVDQWGNRFMEAPMPVERRVSVARGNEYDPRYEQVAPRNPSVARQPQIIRIDDEGYQYTRKPLSPHPDGFSEMPTRFVNDARTEIYEDGAYVARSNGPHPVHYARTQSMARYEDAPGQDARIVRMQSVRPVDRGYDDDHAHDERIVRMQSVRPVERQYEPPREQILRVQSVRPEQPRMVRSGETQEPVREAIRHVSVHPGAAQVRQMRPAEDRYEYAPAEQSGETSVNRYPYQPAGPGRGYVEEMQDDGVVYEAPVGGGKRVMQRM